jgi:hypothetical protein
LTAAGGSEGKGHDHGDEASPSRLGMGRARLPEALLWTALIAGFGVSCILLGVFRIVGTTDERLGIVSLGTSCLLIGGGGVFVYATGVAWFKRLRNDRRDRE